MGPIQSGINQALSIAGLMFTQTAGFKNYQENRKLKRETNRLVGQRADLVAKSGYTEDELKMTTDEATNYFKDDEKKLNDFQIAQHNIQDYDVLLSEKYGNEEAGMRMSEFRFRQGKEDEIKEKTRQAQDSLSASQLQKRNTTIKF